MHDNNNNNNNNNSLPYSLILIIVFSSSAACSLFVASSNAVAVFAVLHTLSCGSVRRLRGGLKLRSLPFRTLLGSFRTDRVHTVSARDVHGRQFLLQRRGPNVAGKLLGRPFDVCSYPCTRKQAFTDVTWISPPPSDNSTELRGWQVFFCSLVDLRRLPQRPFCQCRRQH